MNGQSSWSNIYWSVRTRSRTVFILVKHTSGPLSSISGWISVTSFFANLFGLKNPMIMSNRDSLGTLTRTVGCLLTAGLSTNSQCSSTVVMSEWLERAEGERDEERGRGSEIWSTPNEAEEFFGFSPPTKSFSLSTYKKTM
jgi:hypothetical protein